MTVPVGPTWVQVSDVKAWLRIPATDTADDDLLARCCAAVQPYAQRCRPEFTVWDAAVDPPQPVGYAPDAEVLQAAVQMAARLYRRRNSVAGVEQLTDSSLYVARYDPDLERMLRTGSWAMPGVG